MPDGETIRTSGSICPRSHFTGAFIAALLAISVLASCGGGGGGLNAVGGNAGAAATAPTVPAPAITSLAITNPPPPVAAIPYNSSASISWASSNASACVLYNTTTNSGTVNLATPAAASGITNAWQTPALQSTTIYTLECSNSAGATTQQSVTVTVSPAPTVTFVGASPSTITSGGTTTITWASANTLSCALTTTPPTSTAGSGTGSNGTFTTPALTAGSYIYTVACLGSSGARATQTTTVTVAAGATLPTVTLVAPLLPIPYNTSTMISWTSSNATNAPPCALTSPSRASTAGSGTGATGSFSTGPLTAQATYTVTCSNATGSASDTKIIAVSPQPPPPVVTVTAAPSTIAPSGTSTLTWTSTNSTSCSSPGGGGTGTSGTFTTPALTATTTYTVTCSGAGGTAPGSATVTVVAVAPACPTVNVVGGAVNTAITLPDPARVPARLIGVAPLMVFFDAAGTTATATTRPFHELEYRWNFGDPASGTWANGAQPGVSSKNTATGPVAAHVYEPVFNPGEASRTYTVGLTVTDGANTVTYDNACAAPKLTITVQNPDSVFSGANTVCISAANPLPVAGTGGCPAGASGVVQSNFTTALSTYAKTNTRVLFKRGDTFTVPTMVDQWNQPVYPSITQTGPGIVGSFGTGANPLVQVTAAPAQLSGTFFFSSCGTPAFSDWRLMDLEFDGMNDPNTGGMGNYGGITQITLLRLTMRHFEDAFGISDSLANNCNNAAIVLNRPALHAADQLAIVDTTIVYGPNTTMGAMVGGNRFAVMGNYVDNGGLYYDPADPVNHPRNGSHNLRFQYLGKAVISNNSLHRPGNDRLAIKLHGPAWGVMLGLTAPGPDPVNPPTSANINNWPNYSQFVNGDGSTREVIISDNKLVAAREPWQIVVGPRSGQHDERIRDVILERNLHVGTLKSDAAQVIYGRQITSRNNIIVQPGGTGNGILNFTGFLVDREGIEPPAQDVWIYNNTLYSGVTNLTNPFSMVRFQNTTVSNVSIKNNLVYVPNVTAVSLYNNTTAVNIVASNNSTDAQIKNGGAAPYVSPPFTVPASYLATLTGTITTYSIPTASVPLLVPPFTVPAGFLDNFRPAAGGYAANTGAAVPVRSDFFLTPASGIPDIGAVMAP